MTETLIAPQIYAALRHVAQVSALVPACDLSPEERMDLSGHLRPDGLELVHQVVAALQEEPAAFADHPAAPDGAALCARQDRALALVCLHRLLSDLARRVADLALIDQAECVQAATALLRAVREAPSADRADPRARARRRALVVAAQIVKRPSAGRPRAGPAVSRKGRRSGDLRIEEFIAERAPNARKNGTRANDAKCDLSDGGRSFKWGDFSLYKAPPVVKGVRHG